MSTLASIQPTIRRVIKVGGASFIAERYGMDDAPVCVLCNAVNQTMAAWHRYLPRLQESMNVVLWSYGVPFGESPEDGYELLVEQLGLAIDTLVASGQKVHLLGVCYGGSIAIDYARTNPERVRSLILTGAQVTKDLPFIERQTTLWQLYLAGHRQTVIDIFFGTLFGGRMFRTLAANPELRIKIKEKVEASFTDAFPVLLRYLTSHLAGKSDDEADWMPEDVDLLLLMGRDDPVTVPSAQKRVLRHFNSSRCKCVEYDDVGHLVYMEAEAEFFSEVATFVAACEVAHPTVAALVRE